MENGGQARRPWLEHGALADVLAGWRSAWCGRDLFAVTGGADWVRLHLAGEARDGILLTDVGGARLVLACRGALPPPLAAALPARRDHPLKGLLAGARLERLGLLPDDRVAAFGLARPDGAPLVLLHRLFGARGDTTLLDAGARLLWARHRPPHDLLARIPPPATWRSGTPAPDTLSAPGLDHLVSSLAAGIATGFGAALVRRLRGAERRATNLEADLAVAEQGDELRRRAEALAASLHLLRPGLARIEVTDPRTGSPLELDLDPALPPAANLEAAFRRARKAERGRGILAERLEEARREVRDLAGAVAAADDLPADPPLDRLAALLAWRDAGAGLIPAGQSGRVHAPEEPARPFRRYLLDGRWEVWIGRSNTENDELTHRASQARDIWLHAQGVAGSHVILRTGGKPEQVPRAVIVKAAALAALHSKARHAGLAPVIWTERRYVRKPRKAPAGTAACLREQSVFATPGVPDGAVPI